jgi:hypothetical protein
MCRHEPSKDEIERGREVERLSASRAYVVNEDGSFTELVLRPPFEESSSLQEDCDERLVEWSRERLDAAGVDLTATGEWRPDVSSLPLVEDDRYGYFELDRDLFGQALFALITGLLRMHADGGDSQFCEACASDSERYGKVYDAFPCPTLALVRSACPPDLLEAALEAVTGGGE